jgi:hypothetical protein
MKKWKYKFIDFKDGLIELDILDKEGQDGWELVCINPTNNNNAYGILKRLVE